MSIRSALSIVAGFILMCALFVPAARADNWNEMTELTFNQPVEIPGQVLAPGRYWLSLVNNQSDRDIVRIYNANRSQLEATLMTIPTYREQPTSYTRIQLVERPHNAPEAVLRWYYPGRLIGQEFVYSPRQEKRFARDAKVSVSAKPSGANGISG